MLFNFTFKFFYRFVSELLQIRIVRKIKQKKDRKNIVKLHFMQFD